MADLDIAGREPALPHAARRLVEHPVGVLVLLASVATLIYSNTFSASFHFDDAINIIDNSRIRHLSNFWNTTSHRFAGSRDIGFLTFALNYAVGGLNVWGYHLINLAIHSANGWLVYLMVSLFARTPGMAPSAATWSPERVSGVALTTALLFVVHPIQTQAVTYIVQRLASLATLFYLLAIVCYLRWRMTAPELLRRHAWYAAALASAILAMKTKEISFTLPILLLVIEGVCFRPVRWKSRLSLVPFLLTLPIIPMTYLNVPVDGDMGWTGDTTEISRSSYLCTQSRVLMTYLRLLVLPLHQNVDYDYPIADSCLALPVVASSLVLLGLMAMTVSLLRTSARRLVGLGLGWFFLTLAVESSLIPIQDAIFEHRLYLPSVGFWLAVSAALVGRLPRWNPVAAASVGLVVVLLAGATYQRNRVWKDEVTLWTDVVLKSPKKARAHINLGNAYVKQGQYSEGVKELLIALQLRPDHPEAHNNLGNAYIKQGRLDEAIAEFRTAVQLAPGFVVAHVNLGNAYLKRGRLSEATTEILLAIQLRPEHPLAHSALGDVYAEQGRLEEAVAEYHTALRLDPGLPEAHNSLGIAYGQQGREDEAIAEFRRALSLMPDFPSAHANLGNVYAKQGRLDDAVAAYGTALRLDSNFPMAHKSLGDVYLKQGKYDEAIIQYEAVLALTPDFAEAHNDLGHLYARQGRLEQAIGEFQAAIRQSPAFPDPHNNLGAIYIRQGRFHEAIEEATAALKLRPDFPEAHFNLGSAYLRQGRTPEAIREIWSGLRLKPDVPDAHYNLGKIYAVQGRLDEAIREFVIALALNPRSAEAHNDLGNIYALQGRFDAAMQGFLAAIELNPDLAEAHYNAGSVYARQGRLDDAIREYLVVINLQPNRPDAHYNLANVYKLQGLPGKARQHFEAALQLSPNFEPAKQALKSP